MHQTIFHDGLKQSESEILVHVHSNKLRGVRHIKLWKPHLQRLTGWEDSSVSVAQR